MSSLSGGSGSANSGLTSSTEETNRSTSRKRSPYISEKYLSKILWHIGTNYQQKNHVLDIIRYLMIKSRLFGQFLRYALKYPAEFSRTNLLNKFTHEKFIHSVILFSGLQIFNPDLQHCR